MNAYTDPTQHLFWIASRSFGIVAMLLMSISVAIGLAFSSRLGSRPGMPALLKTVHEACSLGALVAIAAHGLILLGDTYLNPGLTGIAVPFAIASHTFWNGVGIIGGYMAALLGLSFYARRWIGVNTWKRLHRWTVLAWALALAHSLGAGTDAGSAWFLILMALPIVAVIPLFLRRYGGGLSGRDERLGAVRLSPPPRPRV